ncbi:unnamed protein product, partial [Hapterophycus canaliculatus]
MNAFEFLPKHRSPPGRVRVSRGLQGWTCRTLGMIRRSAPVSRAGVPRYVVVVTLGKELNGPVSVGLERFSAISHACASCTMVRQIRPKVGRRNDTPLRSWGYPSLSAKTFSS